MRASIHSLQEEYANYIFQNRIGKNRERFNVMGRFAFMVAARELYTTLEIAKVTGKNHATVIHATKGHEMNLRFDSDYARFYHQTSKMMDRLRGEELADNEWELKRQNATLQERVNKLREELLETRNLLYIKEEELKVMKDELSS
jgi:hypothetical protein